VQLVPKEQNIERIYLISEKFHFQAHTYFGTPEEDV